MRSLPPQSEDEKLVLRRVADMVKAVRHEGTPRYSGFLSDREQALSLQALGREGWQAHCFSGGYQGAERCMLCVFEDKGEVQFPLCTLRVTPAGRGAAAFGHRDLLGAILGLGLERALVGDIVLGGEGEALVVVHQRVRRLVLEELRAAGRVPVQVADSAEAPSAPAEDGPTGRHSVSSLRLDAVLAAAMGTARSAAAGLVEGGSVQVNHVPATKPHTTLEPGDLLTVRGHGRYRLEAVGGKTRKQRTSIEVRKY